MFFGGINDHALAGISYLYGSSNVSQVSLSGKSMLQSLIAQAGSREKMSEIYALGGQETQDSNGEPVEAYVLLDLPWSKLNGAGTESKRPADTSLLGSVITVTINIEQARRWMSGSGFAAYAGGSFTQAECQLRQGNFTGASKVDLKRIMMVNPERILSYPFIYTQQGTSQQFTADSGTPFIVNLQSLINADLIGITVGVIRNSDLDNGGSGANPINPANYVPIRDVRLEHNGEVICEYPGLAYRFWNMNDCDGAAGSVNGSEITSGGASPYSSAPIEQHLIKFTFSRQDSFGFQNILYNCWRIANNSLGLRLTVPDASPTTYTLFSTYFYNGNLSIQSGNSFIQTS